MELPTVKPAGRVFQGVQAALVGKVETDTRGLALQAVLAALVSHLMTNNVMTIE
jgi:hypothetical protein